MLLGRNEIKVIVKRIAVGASFLSCSDFLGHGNLVYSAGCNLLRQLGQHILSHAAYELDGPDYQVAAA
jgi:hypothetical protein